MTAEKSDTATSVTPGTSTDSPQPALTLTDVHLIQNDWPTADPHQKVTYVRLGDKFYFISEVRINAHQNDVLEKAGHQVHREGEWDMTQAILTDQYGQLRGEHEQGTIVTMVAGKSYIDCVTKLLRMLNGEDLTAEQVDTQLAEVKGSTILDEPSILAQSNSGPVIYPTPNPNPDELAAEGTTETVNLPAEDVK